MGADQAPGTYRCIYGKQNDGQSPKNYQTSNEEVSKCTQSVTYMALCNNEIKTIILAITSIRVINDTGSYCYWLLLRGGIVQSVPCNCDHFLICCAPHLSYNHSRFIHQSSLLWLQQTHLIAKRGEFGRE